MEVKSLDLVNFRNYEKIHINFDDKVNIFIGKNAQGKTNLLESIFFCCIGKSFKSCKDKEMIRWGQEACSIHMKVKKKFRDVQVDAKIAQKKSISLCGMPIKRLGELIGEVNIVFFSPQELKLVKESPEERRKFMDIHISQNNKRYFHQLARYEKILANRNKLLKTTQSLQTLKDVVDIWDRALCASAKILAFERQKFVDEILPYAQKALLFISGGKEKLDLKYRCGCGIELNENFEEKLAILLKRNLEKDHRLGYTSLGTHRDDIDIFLNGVEVKSFGSQGQQRTVALCLKLAELENMKNICGEYPILLLDDVFSELDSERQKKLIKFVGRTQTFITCTDEKFVEGKKFVIENGCIKN